MEGQLLVPSPRSLHPNLVVFCSPADLDTVEAAEDHGG